MLNVTLPSGIRHAARDEWRTVADITAQAFAKDPVNRWIFQNPNAIRSCFRVLARETYSRNGICHLAGSDGATMWSLPGADKELKGLAQIALAVGITMHGGRGALKRAMAAGDIMEANHPKTPHAYLFTIGVKDTAQGKGLGKALLAPVLTACEQAGLPIYLENSNPANFGFYAAHGFQHMHHFDAGPGGPPLQAMWRDP